MDTFCDFLLGATDAEVAERLKDLADGTPGLDCRFTPDEDWFLTLDRSFVVESFPIHQDVANFQPPEEYLRVIRALVPVWSEALPGVFVGLSWYFNPRDLFHPLFVQRLSFGTQQVVFLLSLDLKYRGTHGVLLDRGSNDRTPRYETQHLFLEAEVVPLEAWVTRAEGPAIQLVKLFPLTWQGESGRGYFVTGRWLDPEISRLLSRAAFPVGCRTYPVLPLRCHHETLSVRCLDPSPRGRHRGALLLTQALALVEPWAEAIQRGLAADPYREDHPLIPPLRAAFGSQISDVWGNFRLEAYLNSHEQKEYRYHAE